MKKSDLLIAREIVLAQVASDGGKGIDEIKKIFKDSYPAWFEGYGAKEKHELRAMMLICKSKESDFRFYVNPDGLVYFDYRGDLESGKLQVSFHNPYGIEVCRWATRSRRRPRYVTRWDEESSRDACIRLAQLIWEASV